MLLFCFTEQQKFPAEHDSQPEDHLAFSVQPLKLVDKDLWTINVCIVWEMEVFTESWIGLLDGCALAAEKEFAVNNSMFPHH